MEKIEHFNHGLSMGKLSFPEMVSIIKEQVGEDAVTSTLEVGTQPQILVPAYRLLAVMNLLWKHPMFYFDYLACVTGVDNGVKENTLDVIYHLNSIPYEHSIIIKVVVSREVEKEEVGIESVSSIWKTADWQEREIFDMFGLKFFNHPDLRRILLPGDWEGYPLRKDYQEQETYHGIKVKY
jgi:NADH-quinone oxidoreductase subunit C